MEQISETLPDELLNIICEYHHCKNCWQKDTNCLRCYKKCKCDVCKININLNKILCLNCLCNKISSGEKCKCVRCIYLPFLYYHRIKKTQMYCNSCECLFNI